MIVNAPVTSEEKNYLQNENGFNSNNSVNYGKYCFESLLQINNWESTHYSRLSVQHRCHKIICNIWKQYYPKNQDIDNSDELKSMYQNNNGYSSIESGVMKIFERINETYNTTLLNQNDGREFVQILWHNTSIMKSIYNECECAALCGIDESDITILCGYREGTSEIKRQINDELVSKSILSLESLLIGVLTEQLVPIVYVFQLITLVKTNGTSDKAQKN